MTLKLTEYPKKSKAVQLMEVIEKLWKSRSDEEPSECSEGDCCDQWRSNRALTEPCCGEIPTMGRWAVQTRTFRTFIVKQQKRTFCNFCCAMDLIIRELHFDIKIIDFTQSIEKLQMCKVGY